MSVEPPSTHLHARDTVRLISTGRLKAPALAPLASTRDRLDDLASLEAATHGRLRVEAAGLPDLDPRELVFGRPGATFVNAAFAYVRPGGNRFNDEARGAWYAAFTAQTAIAEVSFHLERELAAIGRWDNATDYAELVADFIGAFHDLRGAGWRDDPCLSPDASRAYPAGQALAKRLRGEHGSPGIVYPSARHAGGTCLAAFRPDLVQHLRQGGVWRLTWAGKPSPDVMRVT